MTSVCTGRGASETRALILNDGRPNPHPTAGTAYARISRDEILNLIANPPSVPKEQGQWIIPSEYNGHDARSHAAQRQHGSFWWLAADIDRGGPSLQAVMEAVAAVLPGVYFVTYASRSSTRALPKWRILIPLAQPLTGSEYSGYQEAFFDALEHCGLELDRTLARAGQLVYLPNRGEYYDWQAGGQNLLSAKDHAGLKALADQYIEINSAIAATAGSDRQEGMRSHLAAFRRKHSIEELLRLYGYVNKPGTNHWRSPISQSGSYSTQAFDDHWRSLSHNDAAAGLGKATANGSRYGDAFDLYVHYNCNGDRAAAELYAKRCLAEEDDYHIEYGKWIWSQIETVGNKLGPAGHKKEMEEASKRALIIQADPTIKEEEDCDWDIPWPPGLAGEMAKYIYRSTSRPVKQYAIAMALYILAGIGGQRYNVSNSGINLYLGIVGNSGVGKGEARRAAQRLYGAMAHAAHDPQGVAEVFDHDWPVSASGLRKMFDSTNGTRAIYKEDADSVIDSITNSVNNGSNGDQLRAALSGFYDKSSNGTNMGAVRASKLEDSTGMVVSPSLTVGFDFQVEPFKRFLGQPVVLDTGIGSRFIFVPRYGKRMYSQKNKDTAIPEDLLEYLKTIWNGIRMQTNTVTVVGWEPEAQKEFDELDDEVTTRIRSGRGEEELRNREHVNSAKVAACIAIGINQIRPVITLEVFRWARQFVGRGYDECIKLMASGEVGSGERVRVGLGIKAIRDYVKMPPARRHSSYKVPKGLDTLNDVICEKYFIERLRGSKDFKGSDTGYTTEDLIRRMIMELVRQEYLIETNREEVQQRNKALLHRNTRQPLYLLGPAFV